MRKHSHDRKFLTKFLSQSAGFPNPMPTDFSPEISENGDLVTGFFNGFTLSFRHTTTEEYNRRMAYLRFMLWQASELKRLGQLTDA